MKTETGPSGTNDSALEHCDRMLAWDYVYLQVRCAVLGSAPLRTLKEISTTCGRDPRWAYKLLNHVQHLCEEAGLEKEVRKYLLDQNQAEPLEDRFRQMRVMY